jgi:hypothetical protein
VVFFLFAAMLGLPEAVTVTVAGVAVLKDIVVGFPVEGRDVGHRPCMLARNSSISSFRRVFRRV